MRELRDEGFFSSLYFRMHELGWTSIERAEEDYVRYRLCVIIKNRIKLHKLTNKQAAILLDVKPYNISKILREDFGRLSKSELNTMLDKLEDYDSLIPENE